MDNLSSLPNVGSVLEKNLKEVGISSPEELRKVGARSAFLQIRDSVDPGACLHMLYGIQGAIEGVPDKALSEKTKGDLKEFFRSL